MNRLPPEEPYEKEATYWCPACVVVYIWFVVSGPQECPKCGSIDVRWSNHPLSEKYRRTYEDDPVVAPAPSQPDVG